MPAGPVEQVLLLTKSVLEKRLPERHLHLALARVGVLPAVEADKLDDLIDVVHNSLDDDRRLGVPGAFE